MRIPQLNLSQKGVLLVAVPLVLLCVFYFGLKMRLNAVRQHMSEVEKRMSIVSSISNVELKSFYAFQSLMQLKLHGKIKERMALNEFLLNLQRDESRLISTLRDEEQNQLAASEIEEKFRIFMSAFRKSTFNPNASDEVGSIIKSLDENQRFLVSAGTFFEALSKVAGLEQLAADDSRSRLQTSRRDLETWIDFVVLSTLALTLFTSVQFFRGTVKNLMRLKENAWRFVDGKELLCPLETKDEIGDVDRVFHEMVATIRAAQAHDSYVMKLLQESKDRVDVVLNNLPIAVVVTDASGTIESINPAGAELFEYSVGELKGSPIAKLFPGRLHGRLLIDLLQDLSPQQFEAEAKGKDLISTEVQKKTIDSIDGSTALFAIMDVSERQALERLTKDFYAMVSHDIRSPLHAIDATLEIALSKKYGSLSQEVAERLSGARRNISKLLELVNKLLVIEKLEGTLEFDMVKVDFNQVVESALELYRQKFESKNLSVERHFVPVHVLADRQYLMQVTSNLIDNAVKYSPENSRIQIGLNNVGGYGELTVRDEGAGVPKAMQAYIFERFRQAPSTAGSQSFGLGLAICKQIVEKHGGAIGVRSGTSQSAKSGSEFWVRFRAAQIYPDKASSGNPSCNQA
jgi:PAS domain S-box-containing protein